MIGKLAPNQKAIRIVKAVADKENKYGVFNKETMMKAMRALRPSTFKLWCYLGVNQDSYEFGFSSQDASLQCGMSKRTCIESIKELIEKGYLVEVELYPNLTGYLFIETG